MCPCIDEEPKKDSAASCCPKMQIFTSLRLRPSIMRHISPFYLQRAYQCYSLRYAIFDDACYFHRHVNIYSIIFSATSQLLSQWSFRYLSVCFIASKCRTRTLPALVQRLQRKNSASPCSERECRLGLPNAICCDYLRYSQTNHATTAPAPAHESVQLTSYAISLLT